MLWKVDSSTLHVPLSLSRPGSVLIAPLNGAIWSIISQISWISVRDEDCWWHFPKPMIAGWAEWVSERIEKKRRRSDLQVQRVKFACACDLDCEIERYGAVHTSIGETRERWWCRLEATGGSAIITITGAIFFGGRGREDWCSFLRLARTAGLASQLVAQLRK